MPRVVHALRADHAKHVGGDLVQLHATVTSLRAAGVEAEAAALDQVDGTVDIVHLYNMQLPGPLAADARVARRRWPAAKIVVSPILWPPDPRLAWRAPDQWSRRRIRRAWVRIVQHWSAGRRLLKQADAVLPNSEAERRRLSRLYRVGTDRWHVVPNGLDLAQWPRPESRDGPGRAGVLAEAGLRSRAPGPVIVCVARIEAYKNQLSLVRALHHLPEARLVLAGPDTERSYAGAVRTEAGRFGDRVALCGRRPHDEVRRLLDAADVHVLPSFRETPGLATLEAAAAGCEVVATRHGSAEEYLGELAAYADPTSPADIAAAVRSVLDHPRQPRLRDHVETMDWSGAGRALAAVYRDVLAAH